ncbi:MAG: PHP domain-containing protein [Candidatus Dojkabacteria bacterium]
MFKLDMHMHSTLSYDGGITMQAIEKLFEQKTLDYIAISDHNEIAFAKEARAHFGTKVIVAEEIKTDVGDLIALFIEEKIPSGLSLPETLKLIKAQGGLSYIPHPFDKMRSGISKEALSQVLGQFDILEVFNARYILPGGNSRALEFANKHSLVSAVGSDAHRANELGRTFNLIYEAPTRANLLELLKTAKKVKQYVKPWHYLNPKYNMLLKYVKTK